MYDTVGEEILGVAILNDSFTGKNMDDKGKLTKYYRTTHIRRAVYHVKKLALQVC